MKRDKLIEILKDCALEAYKYGSRGRDLDWQRLNKFADRIQQPTAKVTVEEMVQLNKESYEQLINQDIEKILIDMKPSLERDHIIQWLRYSVKAQYTLYDAPDDEGKDEWIRCLDQVPKEDELTLYYDVVLDRIDAGCFGPDWDTGDANYWQPLPPPPKKQV